jgi:hypothetical protein
MATIFNDVCVLVTAAFALTLVPGFRQPGRSLLSSRDRGTAPAGLPGSRPHRRSHCFARRFAKRTNPGGMHSWSRGRPLGWTGRQPVCHLVGRRTPRPAARLRRNIHVVWWFGRRVAVPLATQAGATPADGILSDFLCAVAAEWPHLLACSLFGRGTAPDRGDRKGPCARFGRGVDSGYRRAGT